MKEPSFSRMDLVGIAVAITVLLVFISEYVFNKIGLPEEVNIFYHRIFCSVHLVLFAFYFLFLHLIFSMLYMSEFVIKIKY